MTNRESHDAGNSPLRSAARPPCASLLHTSPAEAHEADSCGLGDLLAPHRTTNGRRSLHKLVNQPPSPLRAAERLLSCEHSGDLKAHQMRSTSLPSCDGKRSHRTLRDLSMVKLSRIADRKNDAFFVTDVTANVDTSCVPLAPTSALRRTTEPHRRVAAQKCVHWADAKSHKFGLRHDLAAFSESKMVSGLTDTAGPSSNLHGRPALASKSECPSTQRSGLFSEAYQRSPKNERSGIEDFLQKLLLFSDQMVEIP